MSQELARRGGEDTQMVTVSPEAPMSVETYKAEQELYAYVVQSMKEGVHYGIIHGTHGKSLWEPGAEMLRRAFKIPWSYEILYQEEDVATHWYSYRIEAYAKAPNGEKGATWVASGNSRERKFWCAARGGCAPTCQGDHGPRGMEAAMLQNNVFDRVLKRAFVNLMKNVTGASGEFMDAVAGGGDVEESTGGLAKHVDCPEGNGSDQMMLRDGKHGQFYSHKHGSKWHNIDADKVEQPVKEDTPAAPTSTQRDESEESPTPSGETPRMAIETLGDLRTYGASLSIVTKEEFYKALGISDDSEIGDLEASADMLAQYANAKAFNEETNDSAFGPQQ